jgi:hypothetical protein
MNQVGGNGAHLMSFRAMLPPCPPPRPSTCPPSPRRSAKLSPRCSASGTLREANKRLEHLVAELNHAVHGKRSEKLSEDDRQLAFEDLETAVAEAEKKQETQAPSESRPRRAARRNRGNLPADLPRIERVIEPEMGFIVRP